jgi:hypothetical protein
MHRTRLIWDLVLVLLIVLTQMTSLPSSPVLSQDDSYTVWLPLIIRDNTNPIHQGIATYYDATGAGACSFDPSPDDKIQPAASRRA